uniref:Glycoside hydrolase family 5 domain-containing protein n=1 Tax=Nelumbo nucifera TaxID=4432 RepID=A0A822YH11_NELNU|nr:TPA_asm: hypothetical protein HUJ06_009602 [Nelumbo nucifera]
MKKHLLLLFLSFVVLSPDVLLQNQYGNAAALPLYTNSQWIVDENGQRVKLACVNWISHLQPLLAEGLNRQPLDTISKTIVSMGFNCVRFTWPLFMATNESLYSLNVRQSFENLGLNESIGAILVNNPSMLNLTVIQAFKAVVDNLGDNNVMVILDNHISKPGWCCSRTDGNGFFGDTYFDPELWIKGLTQMATWFNGTTNVIGMSLRNELRGSRQNVSVWYKYMQAGAEAIHKANPHVLTILSGLEFDHDLSFLHSRQVKLSYSRKLVFELHWYAFTDGHAWEEGNPNDVCGRIVNTLKSQSLFVLDQGYPLFLSEFGIDLRGGDPNGDRFSNCFFGVAADLDFDWALWAFMGSYYLREGYYALNEVYAVLDWDWAKPRNTTFLKRVAGIQSPFRGPGFSDVRPYNILYHPLTGLCVQKVSPMEPVKLGSCAAAPEAWIYTPQKTLMLNNGMRYCLQADGVGNGVMLGNACSGPGSNWYQISASKLHLSSKLANGTSVCLDIDPSYNIVTNTCQCLTGDKTCDPAGQWFKIITSTRRY